MPEPRKGATGQLVKVLIVESDSDLADTIRKMLHNWGHKAHTCGSGKDALKTFMKIHCDLVLTEALLPDMKGEELISRLKTFSPDMHVVAMTWNNSRELEARIRAQGVLYYMVKPFETESLRSLLEHLSRRGLKATKTAESREGSAAVVARRRANRRL
ncbi:MAG: response regulator [Deltaproteobacteria bacterium HGW-Deltaproteobacteria-21]|nr:MAG: response regulator [Deltaproteobacteria bacterium HGW-Deltaproteobacteria-21]